MPKIINSTQEAVQWFKSNFLSEIEEVFKDSPFTPDMACAIAYQETGYIWRNLVNKGLSKEEVLELCVGDTIDSPNRSAFPQTASQLKEFNQNIFDIARVALVKMAKHTNGYEKAVANQNKFCHGFGIFQYDIQFAKNNPSFFLEKKWCSFSECLKLLLKELYEAKARMKWTSKTELTQSEKIYICIAYNKGTADTSKGFKQGHKNDEGQYYGENIEKYLGYF